MVVPGDRGGSRPQTPGAGGYAPAQGDLIPGAARPTAEGPGQRPGDLGHCRAVWSVIRPAHRAAAHRRSRPGVVDALGLDLLLADLLGDLLPIGDGVHGEADTLLGNDRLVDDDLVLVQHDLVLLLVELPTGLRGAAVGVGDRLALDPDLVAGDRHSAGDGLGHVVLAQSCPAGLAMTGADAELLLGAGHRLLGVRAAGGPTGLRRGVAPLGGLVSGRLAGPRGLVPVGLVRRRGLSSGRRLARGRVMRGGRTVGRKGNAVVLVQALLLLFAELAVALDVRGVPDLVPGLAGADILGVGGGTHPRNEMRLGAEPAARDGRPFRLAGRVVDISLGDLANLLPVGADQRPAVPPQCVCRFRRSRSRVSL